MKWRLGIIGGLLLVGLTTPAFAATTQEQVVAKQQEIEALDKKISELKAQRNSTAAEADVIKNTLERLTVQVSKAKLELEAIADSVSELAATQAATKADAAELESLIADRQEQLQQLIRQLYDLEQTPWLTAFMQHETLSQILAERAVYAELQQRTLSLVTDLRQSLQTLHAKQTQIAEQQGQLQRLQAMRALQQGELTDQQNQQQAFLRQKKEQQLHYDRSLALAEQARAEIAKKVFTLRDAGISLSLTEATDMAKYAAKVTGVRAALLLGVLKMESNVGGQIGWGKFPDNMPAGQQEAFLRITKKNGLDPATTPISGGGAIGPGQFMPTTWEGISGRVEQLLGKTANPYELLHAFVATGIFLADRGATSTAGEYEAVNRYVAGANWQRFTWYGDRVLKIAEEYAKQGL